MTLSKYVRKYPQIVPSLFMTFLLALSVGCGSSGTSGGIGTPPPPPPANAKEWTWQGGSNTRSGISSSVYGTEGVAAAGNIPGGRAEAASWTDSSGNFWLFGGGRVDPLGTMGPRNDLWEYSPASKEWTWVSGSSTVPGNQIAVYGTQGIASSGNVPGGRSEAVSWIDASNNLWLFGGDGFDWTGRDSVLNDLWEFNPGSRQWTWVGGSDLVNGQAVYGTIGVAAAANIPGARIGAVSWTDRSGNFWLFGGSGYDASGNFGSFNDLWEFSPSSKQWTWINGGTSMNVPGVYGTLGVAAAANVPGTRYYATSWTDGSGNLWLFGGLGFDLTGLEHDLNDLWEFSPSSKQWTWVSGSSAVSNVAPGAFCLPGAYGTQGTAAAANVPGGRNAAVSWTDSSGNLWLFGGLGCDAQGTSGSLNDLWVFSATNKTWTWQSGSNSVGPSQGGTGGQPGVYGTEGMAAASNTPGGRDAPVTWTDASGNLWLFGGDGLDSNGAYGMLNDLWSYTP